MSSVCKCKNIKSFVNHCVMSQKNEFPYAGMMHQVELKGDQVTVQQAQHYYQEMLKLNFRPTRSITPMPDGNLRFKFSAVGLATDTEEPMDWEDSPQS